MIERVAIDGKFSEKEAESVMTSLSCQQSLFGYLIVMDCLFFIHVFTSFGRRYIIMAR